MTTACLYVRGGLDHRLGVGDVAVGDHALQVLARHRQDERVRAGAQQQPVVGVLRCRPRRARRAARGRSAVTFLPACSVMPLSAYQSQRVEDDLVERLLAGQHRRQQDAVVVGVRLGAEHGDVVQVGRDACSSSSSVRTPAMPLPTITSFIFFIVSSFQKYQATTAATRPRCRTGSATSADTPEARTASATSPRSPAASSAIAGTCQRQRVAERTLTGLDALAAGADGEHGFAEAVATLQRSAPPSVGQPGLEAAHDRRGQRGQEGHHEHVAAPVSNTASRSRG